MLLESGILDFVIRNTDQGIQNPTKLLESGTQVPVTKAGDPESSTWNPESKTVLDSLTWSDEVKNAKRYKIV